MPGDLHWFTVDYRERDGTQRVHLVNRGFWLSGLPRLILLCRLRGHRPVVDGTEGYRGRPGYRWVTCDRCGVRTHPQGPIDADLALRQPYTGDLPGPWPASPRGTFGGQIVVGKLFGGASAQFKVGNAGSEHVLAGHVRLNPLGALYLHVEDFGRGIQRRLNPRGYHSRVVEVDVGDGHLRWKLWARRDEWSRSDPWWMSGSMQIDPRTILWGPLRYSYEDVGGPVPATVRMPHGDDHGVTLQLQRRELGRRGLRRRRVAWVVDWECLGGIPTRGDRGGVTASSVEVSSPAVDESGWPEEACAAIAAGLTRERARHGFQPMEVHRAG